MTTVWIQENKHPISYLLLESEFFLLLENGDNIILEQTGQETGLWTNLAKN